MPRKTQQVETRLIAEYLKQTYAKFPYIIKQPLGKVSPELMAAVGFNGALRLSRPSRPEVDAVVILPKYLVLVEAKVWSVVNGLAKLPLYKSLVPYTPDLKQYMPRELIMELVVGWTNDNLEIMARDAGVRVVVFHPPWIEEVTERMHKYWTSDYRVEREAKLRQREALGLE